MRYNHKSYFLKSGGAVPSQHHSMTTPLKQAKGIPRNIYILTIAAVLIIGYVAGTRSSELLGVVGPLLGLKVETSTLALSSVQSTFQNVKANCAGAIDK